MSYSVEWIEPIFDRTYGDVITAEGQRNLVNPKGCYNYVDLNRIENNIQYLLEDMVARKIMRRPPALAIKRNWTEKDIPTKDSMDRIIENVQILMDKSNPEIYDTFNIISETAQFTYTLANAIERNLQIMKDQPVPKPSEWLLKVNNGIIVENGGTQMYVEENQVVNIKFVPSGEDAIYKEFTHWSGNTDDLQYVGNVNESPTTYTMAFHDYDDYVVELTAEYATRLPRTLTLHGGTIYDDMGGTTRQVFAGDEILLLANQSSTGKRFYEWQGTEEGLENLTGGPEPSTSWLTMPDCDVELTAFYINAGQHSVTVDGTIQGWYDYKESVYISPGDRGRKYVFTYWSGDTQYLGEVTNSSFEMPDVNLTFWSNWQYVPDKYQVVVNNGTGSGIYNDDGRVTISAVAPAENMGFLYWTLDEGYGHIDDEYRASTYFYMTTSNAVLTAHFGTLRNVIINNYNNSGSARTFTVAEGASYVVDSTEVVGNKILDHWELDDGTTTQLPYFTDRMGSKDRVYTAVYRDRRTFILTVNNGSGGGAYLEKATVGISANAAPSGKEFNYWSTSSDVWDIDNAYASSTTIVMGYDDCSVTANYKNSTNLIYHNLTVTNGSGSGSYYEGQRVTCRGNQAPATYEFSHWEENGTIISYSNPYYFYMGTTDRTIKAVYKPIPYFNVTVINGKLADGTTSGTFIRNSKPLIIMDPAPEGMKFLQWEIITGDNNDVYQPLAENTYIRNLVHDVVVKATYYVPDETVKYTLSIIHKDGSTTTSNHTIGEQIDIYADEPDDGYRFVKWDEDTQYVIDRYANPTVVNMPGRNIVLKMLYGRIGYETEYHVTIRGGELLVERNEETGAETWESDWLFPEQAVVEIRSTDNYVEYEFSKWESTTNGDPSITTVNDIYAKRTFLTVEDFVIDLTAGLTEKGKYVLTVKDGEEGGEYYDGVPVNIYFTLENTEDVHYTFTRWSGDTSDLKLFSNGNPFDITVPGTMDSPQIIRMPKKHISIAALYDKSYGLFVNDINQGYYAKGTEIPLSAEEIEGKKFTYWTGDIAYVDNQYNPNITVTMPSGGVHLVPKYHNPNDNNSIGYTLTSLSNNDTINIEEIVIISGEVSVGFLITDSNGHMYVVTEVVGTEAKIIQLTTTITGGGESGQ